MKPPIKSTGKNQVKTPGKLKKPALSGWPRPKSGAGRAIGLNPIRMGALILLAVLGLAGGYYVGKYVNPASTNTPPEMDQSAVERELRRPDTATAELENSESTTPVEPSAYVHSDQEEPLPSNVIIDTGSRLERLELPSLDIEIDASGAPSAVAPAALADAEDASTDLKDEAIVVARAAPVARSALPSGLADLQRQSPDALPAWQRYAVPVDTDNRPQIVIVIDDLGVNRTLTQQTIELIGPLTLSYLAYAEDLARQADKGRAAGHEIMLHIPMEPTSEQIDPGPNVLLSGMPTDELRQNITWNLAQYEKVVGINNHMGSRFTADRAGMQVVADELSKRGLLFLDSVTSSKSVAHSTAKERGLPYAVRNIFIDHENNLDTIRTQLQRIERLAKRNGTAIAIGHPRRLTLQALGEWLPTLEEKGFQLVPITAVVQLDPS